MIKKKNEGIQKIREVIGVKEGKNHFKAKLKIELIQNLKYNRR